MAVIELFSHLKDASEDANEILMEDSCVASSWTWLYIAVGSLNLCPLFQIEIELPHIVQLLVIVILSSKDV